MPVPDPPPFSITPAILDLVAENAAVVAIIEDPERFELLKIYPGLEQRSYRDL